MRLLLGDERVWISRDYVILVGWMDEEPYILGLVFLFEDDLFEGVMEEIVP